MHDTDTKAYTKLFLVPNWWLCRERISFKIELQGEAQTQNPMWTNIGWCSLPFAAASTFTYGFHNLHILEIIIVHRHYEPCSVRAYIRECFILYACRWVSVWWMWIFYTVLVGCSNGDSNSNIDTKRLSLAQTLPVNEPNIRFRRYANICFILGDLFLGITFFAYSFIGDNSMKIRIFMFLKNLFRNSKKRIFLRDYSCNICSKKYQESVRNWLNPQTQRVKWTRACLLFTLFRFIIWCMFFRAAFLPS